MSRTMNAAKFLTANCPVQVLEKTLTPSQPSVAHACTACRERKDATKEAKKLSSQARGRPGDSWWRQEEVRVVETKRRRHRRRAPTLLGKELLVKEPVAEKIHGTVQDERDKEVLVEEFEAKGAAHHHVVREEVERRRDRL